jgi:ubiquinone/menaquinone biosynthesis C-methylase UbiE
MASNYTANNAQAYERLMGRWSGRLADALIDFAGIETGDRILDVGCGTGSLGIALTRRLEPAAVIGVDIAAPFIEYAKARCADPRLSFRSGDAEALDWPAGSFDCCFSLLALNFVSHPARALAEMRRVTRAGGAVTAAVWDFSGGLVYQRIFWDTAAALDPEADRVRGRHFSSPLTRPGELAAEFQNTGFRDVMACSLTIRMEYRDFDDYWDPLANAQGPVGDYVKRLPPERLERLAGAMRRAYLAGGPDGPRSMAATAWAARGVVPY